MKALSILRWNERDIAGLEAAASRALTVADSVAALRTLFAAFAAELDATEPLFRAQRTQHLCDLQATLRRLGRQGVSDGA